MKTEQRAARCNHRAKDHQCVVPLVLRSSAGAAPQVVGLVRSFFSWEVVVRRCSETTQNRALFCLSQTD